MCPWVQVIIYVGIASFSNQLIILQKINIKRSQTGMVVFISVNHRKQFSNTLTFPWEKKIPHTNINVYKDRYSNNVKHSPHSKTVLNHISRNCLLSLTLNKVPDFSLILKNFLTPLWIYNFLTCDTTIIDFKTCI